MSEEIDNIVNNYDYKSDLGKFKEFGPLDAKKFENEFRKYDLESNGTMTSDKLKEIVGALEKEMSDDQFSEFISSVENNGLISWKEFLEIMSELSPGKKREFVLTFLKPAENFPEFLPEDLEVFIDNFRVFDTDGSGTIDASELLEALKYMGQGATEEEVKELLETFDADNSGEIDFPEFLMMMRSFYPELRSLYERTFYSPFIYKYPQFTKKDIDMFVRNFYLFDVDQSGAISATELLDLFHYLGGNMSPEQLDNVIKAYADPDTQEIGFDNFMEILQILYQYERKRYEEEFYGAAKDYPEFSREEIDVFAVSFRDYDIDGSGTIDVNELDIALRNMGQGSTQEQLKELIDLVDENGNGEIEFKEFLEIMRHFYPSKKEEFEQKFYGPAASFTEFDRDDIDVFVATFCTFDLDQSGTMDANELALAFLSMGQGVTPDQLNRIISDSDENGNGEIEWSEFLLIMRKLYAGDYNNLGKETAPTTAPTSAPTSAPSKETPKNTETAPTKTSTTPTTVPTKTTATTTTTTPTATNTAPRSGSSFGAVRPSTKSTSSGPMIGGAKANKCESCSKTVYPIEAISAQDQIYHKGCFKCQDEKCAILLTLSTFKGAGGKIYCSKHVPTAKPTATTVDGSISTLSATSAPRLKKELGVKKDNRMTFRPGQTKGFDENGEEYK